MRQSAVFLGFSGLVALACAAAGAACATSDASSGSDASAPPPPSGSPDSGGAFVFSDDAGAEAGPLLAPCDPTAPASCPTGFTCWPTHTSASWWIDLYGKCTFSCSVANLALCSSMDGVCGCPVGTDGTSLNCTGQELDGGAVVPPDASLVCVPAIVPGHAPDEGEGGCGSVLCGGGSPVTGPEAGAPGGPADASDQ